MLTALPRTQSASNWDPFGKCSTPCPWNLRRQPVSPAAIIAYWPSTMSPMYFEPSANENVPLPSILQ
jgi:hypothetical protein